MNETPLAPIVDLLFEASLLKDIPRSGFAFLGSGRESIAEHSFLVTFIAFVMSRLHPEANAERLVAMSLLHDLPEARTGDLNHLQKQYVSADEKKAVEDMTRALPFGDAVLSLLNEYRTKRSLEARLAHDADQISLLIILKTLKDSGCATSSDWIPAVAQRLTTETGRRLGEGLLQAHKDRWWRQAV